MPRHEWEQLGELTLQPTSVTLKGAHGQDFGATGDVLVRGFDWKSESSCSKRWLHGKMMPLEWNATQSEGSTRSRRIRRELSRTTEE